MQRKTVITSSFSHPAVEERIKNLDAEVSAFAKLQAKEDAQKAAMIIKPLFEIKVKPTIHSRVQATIDFIKNLLLVASLVFDAVEIDQAAQKKIQKINNEINDRLHVLGTLIRKLNSIFIDPLIKKYGKWLILISLSVGAADSMLGYGSFRHAFTMLQALVASLAIGAVISVTHVLYAPWIKKAKTEVHRIMRIGVILVVAFIFFAWIGNLRAVAGNKTVNIELEDNNIAAVSSPHLNGVAIAIISFALFAAVLFLSLLLWKSKEERLKEQERDNLTSEISKIKTAITALEKQKTEIENNAAIQKSEARTQFDYAIRSIKTCKNIGLAGVTEYKQVYARFHNDIVPPFFSEPCDFVYDESFQFIQPQKTEPV